MSSVGIVPGAPEEIISPPICVLIEVFEPEQPWVFTSWDECDVTVYLDRLKVVDEFAEEVGEPEAFIITAAAPAALDWSDVVGDVLHPNPATPPGGAGAPGGGFIGFPGVVIPGDSETPSVGQPDGGGGGLPDNPAPIPLPASATLLLLAIGALRLLRKKRR